MSLTQSALWWRWFLFFVYFSLTLLRLLITLDGEARRYEDSRQSPIYEEIHFPVPMAEQRLQETEELLNQMRSSDAVTHHETQITSSTLQSGTTVTTRVTTVTKMAGNKKVQQREVKVTKHKGSTTTQLFRQSKMSLRHFLDHRSEWRSMVAALSFQGGPLMFTLHVFSVSRLLVLLSAVCSYLIFLWSCRFSHSRARSICTLFLVFSGLLALNTS